MKRTIITIAATFVLGILVGASALYFLVTRAQTRIIHQYYAGSLTDRVLIATRLRGNMEQNVLSESDFLIAQGVAGVHMIGEDNGLGQNALRMARAYYDYNALPIPASVQSILASVEPVPRESFAALRDFAAEK